MAKQFDSDPYQAVRQAFDAPWPGPKGPAISLSNDIVNVTVYPEDGCRMTSLTAFGYEFLREWGPERRAFQYGWFPMVPWVGRLKNGILHHSGKAFQLPVNKPPHALHGMACFGPWQVSEESVDKALFSLELDKPWPWKGHIFQFLELKGATLHIVLTITTSESSFPAAAGWHPWFLKRLKHQATDDAVGFDAPEEQLKIDFHPDWQEEPGSNELPTGRLISPLPGPWDDCFRFDSGAKADLIWPGKAKLSVTSPGNSLVIFDKQPDAVCVNPMSGPPDCVNTNPFVVTPEHPLVFDAEWKLSRL
jgi:aldose 1-epimerase